VRLTYDFRSREQVKQFVVAAGPEPSVFIPTLEPVTLGELVELDLGLTGQKQRYRLLGRTKWFRRGGSGRRLLPGVSMVCDQVAQMTLEQLVRDARYHSFLFTRADVRLPCGVDVRVFLQGSRGGHPMAAHLGDLSRGGAFVVLSAFPPGGKRGDEVILDLSPDQPERQRAIVKAQIKWLGYLQGQKGFGSEFADIDARVKSEVSRLLALAAGVPVGK
jgi:Tfp pilus assembly protein PilZ